MRDPIRLEQCHCADSLVSLCGLNPRFVLSLMYLSAGDIIDAMFALLVVKSCGNIDGNLPSNLHAKMILNVIIDFVIGLVPFVGDLADAVYKCNSRNAVLLEGHLRKKGIRALKDQRRNQDPNIDMSLPEEFDKYENAARSSREGQEVGTVDNETPARPQPAKQPQRGRSHRSQRGWFGGSKQREDDVERGVV